MFLQTCESVPWWKNISMKQKSPCISHHPYYEYYDNYVLELLILVEYFRIQEWIQLF